MRRRRSGSGWRAALAVGLLAASAGAGGCGRADPSRFAQREGSATAVFLPSGGVGGTATLRHAGPAWPRLPRFAIVMPGVRDKLVPPLADWLRDSSGHRVVRVVVGYVDPLTIPRLPVEAIESGDSLTALEGRRFTIAVADSLARLRDAYFRAERRRLARVHLASVGRTYLVTASLDVRLTLSEVERLARRWNVRTIHLAGGEGGSPPPAPCPDTATEGDGDADPCEGRHLIGTDPYRDAGFAGGHMVLLDTGVDENHPLFQPELDDPRWPFRVVRSRDCWLDSSCQSNEAGDLHRAFGGHGTKSASLLVGTGRKGDNYRGVTDARLDAFRVYHHSDGTDPSQADFDLPAYLNAKALLLESGFAPTVLLSETQDSGGVNGDVSLAADQFFDAGTAIFAPVGNQGEIGGGQLVGAPAASARVLAVGARTAREYGTTWASQARGVVLFRRPKPDLQAPTATLGASTDPVDLYSSHPKTSGAAPYAAGAGMIVRNVLRHALEQGGNASPVVDPGQVYATLLAVGTNSLPSPLEEGAGPFRLPAEGRLAFGKVMVSAGAVEEVHLPLTSSLDRKCRVAIWWADPRPFSLFNGLFWIHAHHDIDLEVAVAGKPPVRSATDLGVFERVELKLPSSGTAQALSIRVIGRVTGCRPQPVYWSAVMTAN